MGGKLASRVHIRFAHTKEVLKGISLVSIEAWELTGI